MEWYLSRITSFVEVDMTASGGEGMSRSETLMASAICSSGDCCYLQAKARHVFCQIEIVSTCWADFGFRVDVVIVEVPV